MIVHEQRPTWLRLIFSYRRTTLRNVRNRLGLVFFVSVLTTWLELEVAWLQKYSLTALPFTLIGLTLGIVLGFRNNTSYDRFWEGRKLWGALVNTSRTLARELMTVTRWPADSELAGRKELVYRVIGFVHALRLHLRYAQDWRELEAFLPASEVASAARESNPPNAILHRLAARLRELRDKDQVSEYAWVRLMASLSELSNIQGACERIRSTPIPHAYTVLIQQIVASYCFLLPFGVVAQVGVLTPVVVLVVSYTFFGLDDIGDELEEPFGLDVHDLPLDQVSRNIEINLRERLGETELPPPGVAQDGVLT